MRKKKKLNNCLFESKKQNKIFEKLRNIFTNTLVLKHYDWNVEFRIKINISNRNANNVFNQKNKNDHWHLIVFFNYKFKKFETRWDTHDKKLYIIMLKFKNWRYYLQNCKYTIRVISNYNNFRYFMITKKLNVKQIRWIEKLIAFDFEIEYRKNKFNFANASSRKFNIIKMNLNDNENNNDDFFFILRNKFRNQKN